MKRKMITLAATFLALSLTACGGSKETAQTTAAAGGTTAAQTQAETKTEGKAGDKEGGNTLTVWCWDPAFNIYAMKEAEQIYQKDHPDFKLNIVETLTDDVETKITTAAAAGELNTLPDIFLMQDNSYQKFLTNFPEVFTDLTGKVKFDDFAQAKVAYSVKDGKNYAVPFDNGAGIFAVRTDLIEKAGLSVKDFTDITWSQFIELGKKVKEATGLPMISQQAGSPDLVCMMMQSCGASMLNEDGTAHIKDNPQLKKSMETYVQLVKDGILNEVTDWDQYVGSLNNSTVVGTVNGCWILASVQAKEDQSGKWAVTNVPSLDGIEGATNYTNNGGSSWGVASSSKNPELAIDFLAKTFGASTELYDAILPKAGAIATYLPAAKSAVYKEPQPFFGGQPIYEDIANYASKIPSNITGAYYYNARDAVGVALTNIIQSGADLEAEIANAQDTVDFDIAGQQ